MTILIAYDAHCHLLHHISFLTAAVALGLPGSCGSDFEYHRLNLASSPMLWLLLRLRLSMLILAARRGVLSMLGG